MRFLRPLFWIMVAGALACGGGSDPAGTASDGGVDVANGEVTDVFQVPDVPGIPDAKEDASPPPDVPAMKDVPCVPNCTNKDCGDDGCGNSCGTCEATEICTSLGTCDPDPNAGCGGLTLAEDWAGEYDGSYQATLFGLLPMSGDTTGDLSFSLKCFNSKLIISGTMSGMASGEYPFELTFQGTYNPDTQELKCTISAGKVSFPSLSAEVEFEGDMPGSLQPDGTFAGTFDVTATAATLGGQVLSTALFSAGADGTWTAAPAP